MGLLAFNPSIQNGQDYFLAVSEELLENPKLKIYLIKSHVKLANQFQAWPWTCCFEKGTPLFAEKLRLWPHLITTKADQPPIKQYCQVCKRLHTLKEGESQIVEDLENWWVKKARCKPYTRRDVQAQEGLLLYPSC